MGAITTVTVFILATIMLILTPLAASVFYQCEAFIYLITFIDLSMIDVQ